MPLCGPAPGDLKLCSTDGCAAKAIARTKCRKHYNEMWHKRQLADLPRSPKRGRFTVHFDVRLCESDASALVRLSRATGKSQAELLREAAVEYLQRRVQSG